MKIKKFPHSCLMFEINSKKILVDPGIIKYKEEYFDTWNSVNVILITHKHNDHIYIDVVKKLNKDIVIYATKEVADNYPELNINIIKEKDIIDLDDIKIEVVKAVHGYIPLLKGDKEIHENIGYIINDGKNKMYITSDTISFKNEYKADFIFIPVSGHGLTMGPFEAMLFSKEVEAKVIFPIHMDNEKFPVTKEEVENVFNKHDIDYEILDIDEIIEIE